MQSQYELQKLSTTGQENFFKSVELWTKYDRSAYNPFSLYCK